MFVESLSKVKIKTSRKMLTNETPDDLDNYRLRRIVKENHSSGVTHLRYNPVFTNILLTASKSGQINVYDDENGRDGDHLDILSQYHDIENKSPIVDVCWLISPERDDSIAAIGHASGYVALLSLAFSSHYSSIECCMGFGELIQFLPLEGNKFLLMLFSNNLVLVDSSDEIIWRVELKEANATSLVRALV
jgi:WD40 repeat protein